MRAARQFIIVASFLSLLSGGAAILLGLYARSCLNPKEARWSKDDFVITVRDGGQTKTFELASRRTGQIVLSLSGSTGHMCEPPYLMLLDVNGDQIDDLYFHQCGGHGYVRHEPESGTVRYEDLGQFDPADAPAVQGYWSHEIRGGGLRLIGVGCGLAGAGTLCLIIIGLGRRLG